LGASGLLADGEILMLLAESLDRVELQDWQIILGDARLTGALLDLLPEQYRAKVRQCLASLDRIALKEMDLPADVKGYALELIDLRGKPKDVLSRLSNSAWTSGLTGEINYLKSLIDLWESTGLTSGDRLILDLSLMQTFDYYTGIVFEVACNNYGSLKAGAMIDCLVSIILKMSASQVLAFASTSKIYSKLYNHACHKLLALLTA
jgi:ATP phosphoribosyltransferase regulatory subunit